MSNLNKELDEKIKKIIGYGFGKYQEDNDKLAQIKSVILEALIEEWPPNFDVASDPMIIAARRGALNDCLEVVRKTLQ